MTNLERWQLWCKDLCSPDIFIRWGFYSIFAHAMQRKVWTGPVEKPLFNSMYVILCAEPGIGKGLVVQEVEKVLRFHKMKPDESKNMPLFAAGSFNSRPTDKVKVDYLIPIGAQSTSYQALVKCISEQMRYQWRTDETGKKKDLYVHSSLSVVLEEMSSLFRKNMDELVDFLLVAFDCGNYTYDTISRGENEIKNCCLNILAGTTPGFIRKTFGAELLDEGFASRAYFINALSNRFTMTRMPEYNEEQKTQYAILLEHVKKVAMLYGQARFTPEAAEYFDHYFKYEALEKRVNRSPKLNAYYARKATLATKLACCIHFSENTEFEVGINAVKAALAEQAEVERVMHICLDTEGKNPLAAVTRNILAYLRKFGPQSKLSLLAEFYDDLPQQEESLKSILAYLKSVGKIEMDGTKYKIMENKQ